MGVKIRKKKNKFYVYVNYRVRAKPSALGPVVPLPSR